MRIVDAFLWPERVRGRGLMGACSQPSPPVPAPPDVVAHVLLLCRVTRPLTSGRVHHPLNHVSPQRPRSAPRSARLATPQTMPRRTLRSPSLIAAMQGSHALPEKVPLVPNHNSWQETAERKRAQKRSTQLPEERGPPSTESVLRRANAPVLTKTIVRVVSDLASAQNETQSL